VSVPPTAAGLGEAVFVRARSAMGMTVTVALEVLLAVLGSNSFADALAVLVSAPEPVGVTVIAAVAEALTAIVANVQVTVVLTMPVQAELAEANVAPTGSVSVIFTPVAGLGPLFVTVSVYVKGLPAFTGFGCAVLVSDRSAVARI